MKITKWHRKCSACENKIYYISQRGLEGAIKRNPINNKCHTCKQSGRVAWNKGISYEEAYGKERATKIKKQQSHLGIKNGMYGKSHSIETRNKMRGKRKNFVPWNKGLTKYDHPSILKISILQTKNNSAKSLNARRKIKIARLRELEDRYGKYQLVPNYNKNSIPIIENYGKKHGYTFQHAENGGEVFFRKAAAWADGYDEEKNVIIEYYEKSHYLNNKTLNEKTIMREKILQQLLECTIIRIHAYNPNNLKFEKIKI